MPGSAPRWRTSTAAPRPRSHRPHSNSAEVTTDDGQAVQRYMRALPTLPLCTHCHGTADKLSPAVTATLKALYPADRATGYAVGEIRGAMTLLRPVPR